MSAEAGPLIEQPLAADDGGEREHLTAAMAKFVLLGLIRQYTIAGDYFKSVGAQSYNHNYGGSRSAVYYQMIRDCPTIKKMNQARREYRTYFAQPQTVKDEGGAILRIVGYRLRGVPLVGKLLEEKVRADDSKMAGAEFNPPTGYIRTVATTEQFSEFILHQEQSG